jgi:hypothetical protein
MPPEAPQDNATRDPFDLWVKRSLHDAWDATLEEQLPDDLLRLCSDTRTEWELMKARWQALDGEAGL